eukprot:3644959-Alexandrium_andersonii.AAC.1
MFLESIRQICASSSLAKGRSPSQPSGRNGLPCQRLGTSGHRAPTGSCTGCRTRRFQASVCSDRRVQPLVNSACKYVSGMLGVALDCLDLPEAA